MKTKLNPPRHYTQSSESEFSLIDLINELADERLHELDTMLEVKVLLVLLRHAHWSARPSLRVPFRVTP